MTAPEIIPLDWDASFFEMPCGLLDLSLTNHKSDILFNAAQKALSVWKSGFLTLKIRADGTDIVNMLVHKGARLIDTEITYRMHGPLPDKRDPRVLFSTLTDPKNFTPLADEMRFSRFFLDKQLPANAVKKLWQASLHNHCTGRSHEIAIFRNPDPMGIVTITENNYGYSLFIVGVLPQFQGKGIGKAMLDEVKHRYGETKPIRVEASILNSNAGKLYLSCGFLPETFRHIVHLVR